MAFYIKTMVFGWILFRQTSYTDYVYTVQYIFKFCFVELLTTLCVEYSKKSKPEMDSQFSAKQSQSESQKLC